MKRKWIGPMKIRELLDQAIASSPAMPPSGNSVYVVSRRRWKGEPDKSCVPLYVGGNTGQAERFRTRVGDLIADMFGFYSEETGHHSGGQSLHRYCADVKASPKGLYIGWLDGCKCHQCEERRLQEELEPKLNKIKPSRCRQHARKS